MSKFDEDLRLNNLGEDAGDSPLRKDAMEVRRPRAGEASRRMLIELEERRKEGDWRGTAGEVAFLGEAVL